MNTPAVTKKLSAKEQVPLSELQTRMNRFRAKMEETSPDWEMAIIISKINLYYFTGTIQDGILIIPRDNEALFWVRRSYERALDESVFPNIKQMDSFRDASASISKFPETVFMETEIIPLALYQRIQKYFPFKGVRSVEGILAAIRAVKSSYELSLMEQSGRIHQLVMEEYVPKMLRENISEAELAGEIYSALLKEGHDGILRVGTFDSQIEIGLVSFGESSLYPTYFAGPGGNYGMNTAMPFIGSRERKLKKVT